MESIFVETYGCAANFSEGEMIKGILKKDGFGIADSKQTADVIILNICTVKGNNVALRAIKRTYKDFSQKKLIIAGCVSAELVPQLNKEFPAASIANTHNVYRIAEAVKQVLLNVPVQFIERSNEQKIGIPRVRKNPMIGIIPISHGCDSACSFCSVKFIKGNHSSYTVEKIISELKSAVNDGCKEIWITGQDTSCYGFEIGKNLPWLLKQLVHVDGEFRIRLGMANPKHVKDYLKELIEAFKSEKMFRFLHIPVQSGNNAILSEMKRGYSVEDIESIIKEFRKHLPDITLSTDIICGFPGETAEQFDDTVNLLNSLKFDVVNISRFSARHGTLAARMNNQISSNDKKSRSKVLTDVFANNAYALNKKWVGWTGEIVIDEIGKHNAVIGRNYAYKLVVLKGAFSLGQKVNVKITDCASTHLLAELA